MQQPETNQSVKDLVKQIETETGKEISQTEQVPAATQDESPQDLRQLPSLAGNPNPVGAVIGGLSVTKVQGTHLMQLSYRGPNADDYRIILASVAESYKQYLKGKRNTATQDTVRLITTVKGELSDDLAELQKDYHAFRLENAHLPFKSAQGQNMHQSRMREIEGTRSSLLVERSQLNAQYTEMKSAIDAGTDRETLLFMIDKPETAQILEQAEGISDALVPLSPLLAAAECDRITDSTD